MIKRQHTTQGRRSRGGADSDGQLILAKEAKKMRC